MRKAVPGERYVCRAGRGACRIAILVCFTAWQGTGGASRDLLSYRAPKIGPLIRLPIPSIQPTSTYNPTWSSATPFPCFSASNKMDLQMLAEAFPPAPQWTAADVPDMEGKVVAVTGGYGGIGYYTVVSPFLL